MCKNDKTMGQFQVVEAGGCVGCVSKVRMGAGGYK